MEAILNVYDGCESAEPIKTFVCRRVTLGTSNAFDDLGKEFDKLTEEFNELTKEIAELKDGKKEKAEKRLKAISEQMFDTQTEIIKLFFPTFTREDMNGVDPNNYYDFCETVGMMRASVFIKAQKN